MKLTIRPVYPRDVDQLCSRLYEDRPESDPFRPVSMWFVSAKEGNRIIKNVDSERFKTLLTLPGEPPTRPMNDPVAWKIHFEPGRPLDTLWAIAEVSVKQKVQSAHAEAVVRSIFGINDRLQREPRRDRELGGAVFANFTHVASPTGSPYIHSEAFLINATHVPDTDVRNFSSRKVLSQERYFDRIYRLCLTGEIGKTLGPVTSVMRDLTAILRFDVSTLHYKPDYALPQRQGLEAAFAHWRTEAHARNLTAEVLREALDFSAKRSRDWPHQVSSKGLIEKARSFASSAMGVRFWFEHQRALRQKKGQELAL